MTILRRFTPLVEPISIDEAFLDVTGSAALFGDGPAIARQIKDDVRAEVGLTASVGVAGTKLVAKIASDLRKPDGLVVVAAGRGGGLPGAAADRAAVGRRREDGEGAGRLRGPDDRRPRGAAARPRSSAGSGSTEPRSSERARGIDPDPVHEGDPAKSVGHEHTFDVDTSDRETIERTLLAMADGVAGRLRSAGRPGRDGRGQDPRLQLPDDHPPADPGRTDRPDRADLPGRPRAGPPGGPRHPRPAARRDGLEPRRARAAGPVRDRPSPGGGGPSRPPTRSAGATGRAA